jgi:hypothetical protein
MDSLFTILGNKDYDEPPEIENIKQFVRSEFDVSVGVQVRNRDIVISVPNAALANTLRLRQQDIKKRLKIDKRLTFRIGG